MENLRGSTDDLRDGFIHLSTHKQVSKVINRYFLNEKIVYVIRFLKAPLLKIIKWEKSSGGELYPHLYQSELMLADIDSYEIVEVQNKL